MTQGLFDSVKSGNLEVYSSEFIRNFQTALLLSLLDRGLLTQQQFERCTEEIEKLAE